MTSTCYCDMRLLRERQATVAQYFWAEERLHVGSNGSDHALTLHFIATFQEAGHWCCDQLKSHIFEHGRERIRFVTV